MQIFQHPTWSSNKTNVAEWAVHQTNEYIEIKFKQISEEFPTQMDSIRIENWNLKTIIFAIEKNMCCKNTS